MDNKDIIIAQLQEQIDRLKALLYSAAQTADAEEIWGRDSVHATYAKLCECHYCNCLHDYQHKCAFKHAAISKRQ